MNKITLAGREYNLPEITYGTMRKLGKLGFKMSDVVQFSENPFEFMSIMVAYITNSSIEEADELIDKSISKAGDFAKIAEILTGWFAESDFLQRMQAE